MIEELKRTEHLVYVDTALELSKKEHEAVQSDDSSIDYEKIV